EKHSPMFGHDASSQTVWRLCARRICLISAKRGDDGARTRIHSGLRRRSVATTLIGILAVFASPRCLTPAAPGGETLSSVMPVVPEPTSACAAKPPGEDRRKLGTRFLDALRDAEIGELRDGEPSVAAGVDVGKRRKIHCYVYREPVIRAAVSHPQSE